MQFLGKQLPSAKSCMLHAGANLSFLEMPYMISLSFYGPDFWHAEAAAV